MWRKVEKRRCLEYKEVWGGGVRMKFELKLMVGSDNSSNGPLVQQPPTLIYRSVLADIQHQTLHFSE